MGENRFTAHKKALGIAVAVLFPASFGVAQAMTQHSATPATVPASSGLDYSLHQAALKTRSTLGPAGPVLLLPGDSDRKGIRSTKATRALSDALNRGSSVVDETRDQRVRDVSANTSYDIPAAALKAYHDAARQVGVSHPSCHLSWGILAAIGQVESDHGRYGGASVLADGTTYPRIVGLPLNGVGNVARIPDSDGGRLDGDTVWDRAVGPMQFIPTTWATLGADGDGDGVENPSDFDDAALATAQYLCGGGGDMRILTQARSAVYRYNHSDSYVDLVLSLAQKYDSGVVDVVPNDPAPPTSDDPEVTPKPDKPKHHDSPKHHPKPKPDPKPKPKPKPDPKPGPVPAPPKPTPKPPKPHPHPHPPTPPTGPPVEPTPLLLKGLVTQPGPSKWAIGETLLDFGAADLSATQADYDGDGTPEPLADELAGMVGTQATATLGTDLVVVKLNWLDLAQEAPPAAPSTEPPSTSDPDTAPPSTSSPSVTEPEPTSDAPSTTKP